MTMNYCNCNNQQPEEVKRGVIVCQNCNKEVSPADIGDYDRTYRDYDQDMSEAPETSDEEVEFYQDAGMRYVEREVFGL